MRLYNVEIFSPDFSYRSSAQVDAIEHGFDYLDVEKEKIKIPGWIDARRGDWIRISKDRFEANGIISDVKEKERSIELQYKPFHKIFDIDTYIDMESLSEMTLENWLARLIGGIYVQNEDTLQNIEGLEIKVLTEHRGASFEDYQTGINNLYDVILDAFVVYGVVCDFSMDVQRKKLVLQIGSVEAEKFTIEADLDNVLEKSITIKETKESTNKLIIYNKEDYSQKVTYYRNTNNEITTENRNRELPVVCDTVAVKVGARKTFEETAEKKAGNTLKASVYDNLIEITVALDDELVRPTERVIGQQADIISGGICYHTVLTGMEYDEDKILLIFGAIRLELTKQLKRRFRQWESR